MGSDARQLKLDHAWNPLLFEWAGSLDEARLNEWIAQRAISVPDDLREVWLWTGGGEMFESEVILSPLTGEDDYDSLELTNRSFHEQGLSTDYLVFEEGVFLGAIRQSDLLYVDLDYDTLEPRMLFPCFDDWYTRLIRESFRRKYRLPEPG